MARPLERPMGHDPVSADPRSATSSPRNSVSSAYTAWIGSVSNFAYGLRRPPRRGAAAGGAFFPEEHAPQEGGVAGDPVVRIKLKEMSLRRPRQWGACWLGCELWQQLGLESFWREHLPAGREGTRRHVMTLAL